MNASLGIKPIAFIPPLNEFDANTPVAMTSEDMSIMSPECAWGSGGKFSQI